MSEVCSLRNRRDQIYFCVTDGHHWVFFLLRQDVNDKDKWTAFYSEEHDTTWIAGTDGGKPNPHLTFVLRLLLEWVSSIYGPSMTLVDVKSLCFRSVARTKTSVLNQCRHRLSGITTIASIRAKRRRCRHNQQGPQMYYI